MFRKFKQIYDLIIEGAQAYAKWEYEMSVEIMKDKRRLLALLFFTLIPIALCTAAAAKFPDILGGKHAYAPVHSTNEMLLISVIIGLIAGLITGCIGAGGGFVITPALMSIGVRGILAVGTDQFHIFAKSIMGTTVHKKLGNVSVGLAVAFVMGSIVGATVGGTINRAIFYMNPSLSDLFINIVYVLLLGFLGVFALVDYIKLKKKAAAFDRPTAFDGGQIGGSGVTKVAMKVQSIHLPPMITFDEEFGGRSVSAWFVVICGFIVGLLCAIMGVGGGFLIFPMYVYLLGVSSFTTVGTSTLQIIFTTGYSSVFQYAIYGFVFYTLAMGLLLGSLLGIQIGALVTKVVKGLHIRGFYAVTILAGFINRLFALPSKLMAAGWITLDKGIAEGLDLLGLVIFFGILLMFAGYVLWKFVTNISVLKEV